MIYAGSEQHFFDRLQIIISAAFNGSVETLNENRKQECWDHSWEVMEYQFDFDLFDLGSVFPSFKRSLNFRFRIDNTVSNLFLWWYFSSSNEQFVFDSIPDSFTFRFLTGIREQELSVSGLIHGVLRSRILYPWYRGQNVWPCDIVSGVIQRKEYHGPDAGGSSNRW